MNNNEDKIYNLLEKVYLELQDTKKDVSIIGKEVSKIGVVIENEIKPDIKSLFEIQSQILDKLR